jgi:hypothetical protein
VGGGESGRGKCWHFSSSSAEPASLGSDVFQAGLCGASGGGGEVGVVMLATLGSGDAGGCFVGSLDAARVGKEGIYVDCLALLMCEADGCGCGDKGWYCALRMPGLPGGMRDCGLLGEDRGVCVFSLGVGFGGGGIIVAGMLTCVDVNAPWLAVFICVFLVV